MITKGIGENGINIAAICKEKKEGTNNRDNG
jgi:ribosomal protein L11